MNIATTYIIIREIQTETDLNTLAIRLIAIAIITATLITITKTIIQRGGKRK